MPTGVVVIQRMKPKNTATAIMIACAWSLISADKADCQEIPDDCSKSGMAETPLAIVMSALLIIVR